MSLDDEMNDIAKAEVGGSYITKACVEVVTIKSYKMSPTDAKFTGCPFIEFTFETKGENKEINSSRLYRVRDTDSQDTKDFKNRKIKELLTHAGANFTLGGEKVIADAVGKEVKALFKEVEYPGVDAQLNNKPVIKTKIEYSFSTFPDKEIKGNQSYFYTPLNDKDKAKLGGDLVKWERDNVPQGESTAQPVGEVEAIPNVAPIDDLPF
jgi:hypothetical protein